MTRLRQLRATAVSALRRRSRDILAVVGVLCVAAGLSTFSVALAWIVVGAFLVFAAGTGKAA